MSGGFRPKRGALKLDFSGTEFEGLEVAARPVPTSVMLDLVATATAQEPTAYRHMATTLAYALESWNVEGEDGEPVPADLDGLLSQDPMLVNAVIKAWIQTMAALHRPRSRPASQCIDHANTICSIAVTAGTTTPSDP